MLINLSNHPAFKWSETQIAAAHRLYGEIVDLSFPQVDPSADENEIDSLAVQYVKLVADMAADKPATVHLMGEMSLTFALVALLQKAGFSCVASTTQRIVNEFPNGRKEVQFQFVRFRKYPQL